MTPEVYHNKSLNYIKVIDLAIHIATKSKKPFVAERFEGRVPVELNLHYKVCGYTTELYYDELNNISELRIII